VSLERASAVLLDQEQWQICAPLAARGAIAARRYSKALPGDRREAVGFEQLADQIERAARLLAEEGVAVAVPLEDGPLAATGSTWVTTVEDLSPAAAARGDVRAHLEAGGVAVELRDPLARGKQASAVEVRASAATPAPPAAVWRPPPSRGRQQPQAVLWESQLAAAGEGDPLVPSNISNRILTEGLRRYVKGDEPVAARIVYQDGSEAAPFPLRCLALSEEVPGGDVLRLALISMRHNEMDDAVDGCLLRNRIVSRVRPAAETDQLAYVLAAQRLRALAGKGLAVELYQTGFQPAVIGFYRALVDQLREAPGSVALLPRFHIHGSEFRLGLPWAVSG
jgi:hypothetical protein